MLLFFIYLYFISSVVVGSLWAYSLAGMDLWALKNWVGVEMSEEEWELGKKWGTITVISPLSILFLIIFIYVMIKEKLGK